MLHLVMEILLKPLLNHHIYLLLPSSKFSIQRYGDTLGPLFFHLFIVLFFSLRFFSSSLFALFFLQLEVISPFLSSLFAFLFLLLCLAEKNFEEIQWVSVLAVNVTSVDFHLRSLYPMLFQICSRFSKASTLKRTKQNFILASSGFPIWIALCFVSDETW